MLKVLFLFTILTLTQTFKHSQQRIHHDYTALSQRELLQALDDLLPPYTGCPSSEKAKAKSDMIKVANFHGYFKSLDKDVLKQFPALALNPSYPINEYFNFNSYFRF